MDNNVYYNIKQKGYKYKENNQKDIESIKDTKDLVKDY